MANLIRLCYPYNFKAFIEYDGHKFTGVFSSFAMDLIGAITRASNITVEIRSQDDQAGERIEGSTGSYSGCIGLLQTNQSDGVLFLTDYPHPAVNISQGIVITEVIEQMITAYHPEMDAIKLLQMERSFSSFRPEVWILCFLTMVCGISILTLKEVLNNWVRRMIGVKKSARSSINRVPADVVAHMTNHGQLTVTSGLIRKIMFIVLSLFSFLVILQLCVSIKTDLVVIAPPKTLRSYQQLIDNQGGLFFFEGSDHHLSFKFAPQGSLRKMLWDFSVAKYALQNIMFSYGHGTTSSAKILMNAMASKHIAFICDSGTSLMFMRFYCDIALNLQKFDAFADMFDLPKEDGPVMPLLSRDENARVFAKGFISNGITSAPLKRLDHTLRRIIEAGSFQHIMRVVNNFDLEATPFGAYGTGNATTGKMEHCVSSALIMPDSSFDKMTLGNLVNFPLYCYCVITIQVLVLLAEILVSRCNRCKKYRKRRGPAKRMHSAQLLRKL